MIDKRNIVFKYQCTHVHKLALNPITAGYHWVFALKEFLFEMLNFLSVRQPKCPAFAESAWRTLVNMHVYARHSGNFFIKSKPELHDFLRLRIFASIIIHYQQFNTFVYEVILTRKTSKPFSCGIPIVLFRDRQSSTKVSQKK